jgi:hypothetical protein
VLGIDPGSLVTTPLAITETGYLLDRQLGPEADAALFSSIELIVEHLPPKGKRRQSSSDSEVTSTSIGM